VIQLIDINKSYRTDTGRVHALEGISVHIPCGDFVAIMGPSGSGKSTLLSIMGLINRPSKGKILLDGQDVSSLTEKKRTIERSQSIGFVFQFPGLVNTLTVIENVLLPTMLYRKTTAKDHAFAKELLEQVGLNEKVTYRHHQLSGGEQRRVALARAIVNNPKLILADEPTGALDEETACGMMELFESFHKDGKTIIMVTHDQTMAKYARRVMRIKNGVVESEYVKEERTTQA
jgi:ABC-type lipoprotein export system ATPase subunit